MFDTLLALLEKQGDGYLLSERGFSPDALFFGAVETRVAGEGYFWDGMRRGGVGAHPYLVFQYTLAGEGVYRDTTGEYRLTPGYAFAAVVPGENRYFLPEGVPAWRFFWVIVRHPYVAQRFAEREKAVGAVWQVPEESVLPLRALQLLTGEFPDRFAEEEAVFAFLMAFERFAQGLLQGDTTERDRLLAEVRGYVLAHLAESFGVEVLALQCGGMSRSRFSHQFQAATGTTPAHFIARVRVEEVARLLVQTTEPLSAIAAQTGFADATHLCKVFRRFYRVSPGAFRRQMR